ncbi:hypothetical protein IE077_000918 [Cardiosporidium cionae]|uniref:RRP15-like protein n=1 Tax=Cardiosporidium cionae TaxID=476202 RepID=A0ABQ7J685_9APIC|nr:hypothetical protein IE077_000918 [Cardiosporidium cionae]|eukprot:KAF8819507.1 hypothetical protein IE077_000918 [Cardiosporidium cionae]
MAAFEQYEGNAAISASDRTFRKTKKPKPVVEKSNTIDWQSDNPSFSVPPTTDATTLTESDADISGSSSEEEEISGPSVTEGYNGSIGNTSKGFASAFRSIMERPISNVTDHPILVEQPEVARSIDEKRSEEQLKKTMILKRRETRDLPHFLPDVLKKDHERHLKRIANRGVLKLFNTLIEFRRNNPKSSEIKSTKLRRDKRVKKAIVAQDDATKQQFMKLLKKN